jgi:hypothetical protein
VRSQAGNTEVLIDVGQWHTVSVVAVQREVRVGSRPEESGVGGAWLRARAAHFPSRKSNRRIGARVQSVRHRMKQERYCDKDTLAFRPGSKGAGEAEA